MAVLLRCSSAWSGIRRREWHRAWGAIDPARFNAEVEVTYRKAKDDQAAVWLPWKMSETYDGPVELEDSFLVFQRSTCTAEYGDYRRIETSVRTSLPK